MKRIHIRKPDIKGFFVKIKNLKREDIKRHFQEKKERRRRILEERRSSSRAKKMQPVYKWMNRLSLPLHFLLACVINFLIELISRLSFFEAWNYMVGTPLVFLYNAFLIFATFSIIYLVRRRVFARILLSVFWLFLGTCNGYLLTKRVTPFNAQDLKVLSDALELTGNYFNTFELIMIIIGVVALVHVEARRSVYREDAPDYRAGRSRRFLRGVRAADRCGDRQEGDFQLFRKYSVRV